MIMTISDSGVHMIASFEGCRLKAYWDKTGKVWTIGYGHTEGVKEGDVITDEQAITFLKYDCRKAENSVNKYNYIYKWNQNEFDALVSFTFNCGGGSLKTLLANGTRSRKEIADKLPAYNKSGGQVLAGLTRRRKAEQKLFLTPVETVPKTGWIQDDKGKWYYRNADGTNVHGWKNINHHRYFFDDNGEMKTGWFQTEDGAWYYAQLSGGLQGALYHSIKKDGNETGVMEMWYIDS